MFCFRFEQNKKRFSYAASLRTLRITSCDPGVLTYRIVRLSYNENVLFFRYLNSDSLSQATSYIYNQKLYTFIWSNNYSRYLYKMVTHKQVRKGVVKSKIDQFNAFVQINSSRECIFFKYRLFLPFLLCSKLPSNISTLNLPNNYK